MSSRATLVKRKPTKEVRIRPKPTAAQKRIGRRFAAGYFLFLIALMTAGFIQANLKKTTVVEAISNPDYQAYRQAASEANSE